MSDDSKPKYVYKLIPSSSLVPEHAQLPDALPVSDLDQSSGFIHLSTATQVPGTLKFFFKDVSRVYVLRIVYDKVEDKIRWEDPQAQVCGARGGEGVFPHLYNGLRLGKDEVERVETLEKGDDDWGQAVHSASWLVW
ncbi:hypothetical protein HETIRDRAFT_324453 [Heterobasidion irregulare TC 32-1]|uniref:DUF952 domain-containing protein n=1 Tax=Heterobasidion irregulare (strain TC 32-1) TaxID=747525 RepID=W4JZN0_HETIT|nr:uncharacterized protein HETIRDRAFT_324453 [Heterobasidion irregulare TC 32-1]ETW79007.1 hypothetical protein HETIRDRAFT_324453 [Heterobasidion irregulare TC 32-1]